MFRLIVVDVLRCDTYKIADSHSPLHMIAMFLHMQILVGRWMDVLGFQDLASLYARFVFVPKLDHPAYLKFVSFKYASSPHLPVVK